MTRVVLATRNDGKVRELARLLDDERLQLVSTKDVLPPSFDVDETGVTFAENAWLKAAQVCHATGLAALADDSGLEVDAIGGRPGVHSARYAGPDATDEANNQLLLHELLRVPDADRTARFVCVLAFAVPVFAADGRTVLSVEHRAEARGVIEGRIIHGPRGSGGFGYDPLFEPLELPGSTTAEILPEKKNAMSHRGQASRAIRAALVAYLDGENPVKS